MHGVLVSRAYWPPYLTKLGIGDHHGNSKRSNVTFTCQLLLNPSTLTISRHSPLSRGNCRLQTKTRISRMEKEIRIINKWHQRIQPANRPMEVPSRHPFLLAPGRIPNNSAILILTRIVPRQRIAHVVPLACIIRNDPGHFVVMFGHQLGRIVLDGGIEGVGPLHDPRRETTVSKQLSVDTQGRRGQKHLFRSGNPISISIEQVNDQIQSV